MDNKKKVLIVDDEHHMRASLMVLIKRLGHDAIAFENGNEALKCLIEHQMTDTLFDLLICDIAMPIINGDELVAKIRENNIQIPVLVITGIGDKDLAIKMMRLGCCDFIDKPFNPTELEERVLVQLEDSDSKIAAQTKMKHLALIGEISRSVIHDVNNLTGATIAFSDLLLEDITKEHPMYNNISKINKSSLKTADVCKKLLVKNSSEKLFQKTSTNINMQINKITSILKDICPKNVKIKTNMPNIPIQLNVDAEFIQQAILNLGFNAMDAMSEGGTITIETKVCNAEHNEEHLNHNCIVISVKDEGCGIQKENLKRIFDESFTTKESGNGIGLYTVKRIVEEHGGWITVKSTVGKGTKFDLFFPINTKVAAQMK